MKRLIAEPLLHFVLLGALVFVAYPRLAPDAVGERQIRITAGQQEHLVTAFTRTWQRPPTQQEFERLVDDWIREEIAVRESRRMGLDDGDTIVRRRLRQKLELLAEDVVSLVEPSEEELQAYLDAHPEKYREEPRWTFEHIYFSADRRGDATRSDAQRALQRLRASDGVMDPGQVGDPLPLPRRYEQERASAVAAQFGQVFVEALGNLERNTWAGPVRSGYGLHLVRIDSHLQGRPLTLAETRNEVRRDWSNQRRIEAIDGYYQRLREMYEIVVEPAAMPRGAGG